ncbi:MAG: carbonic anhydrase, partial [Gemmataceae bacterium]
VLNKIPLASLAAILLVTGAKLINFKLIKQMWDAGWPQFIPFAVTVVAIVRTDLLIGVLIGLAVSIAFILQSNMRRPIRRTVEKHLGGEVVRIELANQVSFLNRAVLTQVLDEVPEGGHVFLDARNTNYIDPDVLALIREYSEQTAPVRNIKVSLQGFREKYQFEDRIEFVDYATGDVQKNLTPQQVLQILKEGHERFRSNTRLTRDLDRALLSTAAGQHPLAVVLSCIDSRSPNEMILDAGLGDIFSIRIAGNVISRKILASAEYGCAVAGAKVILVLGHTRCGAVTAAVEFIAAPQTAAEATGCQHIETLLADIQQSAGAEECRLAKTLEPAARLAFIDEVARRNVVRVVGAIRKSSSTLDRLASEGRILIVGAVYDVTTGQMIFLDDAPGEPAAGSFPTNRSDGLNSIRH